MSKKIALFLSTGTYEEVKSLYEGKEREVKQLIYNLATNLVKEAKLSKMSEKISANIMVDGKPKPEQFDFADTTIKKHDLKSDATWVPEGLSKGEFKKLETGVTDRTFKEIQFFSNMLCTRYDLYNASLDQNSDVYKKMGAELPKCIEQVVHEGLIQAFMDTITAKIDESLKKEFDEANPEEKIKGKR